MPTQVRRRKHLWLKAALALVATLVLIEATVRFLLFSDAAAHWRLAGALRVPARLADPYNDELYWQVQNVWNVAQAEERVGTDRSRMRELIEPPLYDPILGWRGMDVAPGDYGHALARAVADRRAVLLYGDSFAECTTPEQDCFEGVLDRSELGARYGLLNYGCGGYGLDQIFLLMKHSLDQHAARNPVVVVSLLVDEDMDRSLLGFRSWPKPRLVERDGGLALEQSPVPRRDDYFDGRRLSARSYAWRLFVHGTRVLPEGARRVLSGETGRIARVREINGKIFAAIEAELVARKLEHFYVLFYSEAALVARDFPTWRDAIACDALRELGAPVVSARRAILEHAEAAGRPVGDYFERAEPAAGHYNALGNEAAFAAIRAGLLGRFDVAEAGRSDLPLAPVESGGLLASPISARKVLRGVGAEARLLARPGEDGASRPFLLVRPGPLGPTEVHLSLAGRALALRARAEIPGEAGTGRKVGLVVVADGQELARLALAPGEAPAPLALDLTGRHTLEIRVDDGGDGDLRDALVLDAFELELAGGGG